MTRTGATTSGELKQLPLPDVGDFIFMFVMWLNLFVIPNHLFVDGSTGWHIVAGDFILKTATIPNVDLFSSTFPQKDWVAYEWLYDLFIAVLVKLGGLQLLAVVLTAAIGFLFVAIYDRIRREGAGIATASSLVVVAILTSVLHWLARPHLVTFFCVFIFSTTLEDYYRGRVTTRRLFTLLCLIMLLWVNCHPAFMLGLVIIGFFVISAILQSNFNVSESERARFKLQRNHLLILWAALLAITFINPYGYHLHEYILGYMRGSEIISATDEFQSPVFKGGLHPTCLEILFLAFAGGLFAHHRRITMPGLLTCLAFGYASLNAQRNLPLYAIIATPYIGELLARPVSQSKESRLQSVVETSGVDEHEPLKTDSAVDQGVSEAISDIEKSVVTSTKDVISATKYSAKSASGDVAESFFGSRIKKSLADFEAQEAYCKMHLLPMGYTMFLVIVAICGSSLMGKPFLTSTFDPKTLPVETARYIEENHIDVKHLFNYDNWGGFLRYKLGQRVFIDDRADFYGLRFYARYSTVMVAAEGWQKILDEAKIDWILFPKNSTLAAVLQTDKNWKLAADDQSSVLYSRVTK